MNKPGKAGFLQYIDQVLCHGTYKAREKEVLVARVCDISKYNSVIGKFGIPPERFWNLLQRISDSIMKSGTLASRALVYMPCLNEQCIEYFKVTSMSFHVKSISACILDKASCRIPLIFQCSIKKPSLSHIAGPT